MPLSEPEDGPFETPLLNRVRRILRAEVDPDFEFLELGGVPWAPPRAPLADLRVALVTTADLHLRGDTPFATMENRLGDTSFRLVPDGTAPAELALDAPYVDEKYIPRDPEVALPMRALADLVAEGTVGAAAPRHVSFAQGIVRPLPGLADSVRALVPLLSEDEVDAVVLLPTCSLCVQTVAILARELEAAGFATVALTMLPELTRHVGVPRALSQKFPFGAPAGDPGNRLLQRAVLSEALARLDRAREPGEVVESGLAWRRDPA